MIFDVTVAGTRAASNLIKTIYTDKYSAVLTDHGAHLKDVKHAHYIGDKNAIGFALDSRVEFPKQLQTLLTSCIPRVRMIANVGGTQRA